MKGAFADRQEDVSAWPSPTLAAIIALCLIGFCFPVCAVASAQSASPTSPENNALQPWEFIVTGVLGYGVAWMIFLKDFRRYKGLHLKLFRSGYAWTFLIFVTAATFAIDLFVLHFLQKFALQWWVSHLALGLGHPVASSVVTKTSPYVLALIPAAPAIKAEHDNAAPEDPEEGEEEEKPVSEMNVIFDSIREFLDNQRNSVVQAWTKQYEWEKIKFVAVTLIEDRMSGSMTRKRGEQLKQQVEKCEQCSDVWSDRKLKYRVLLKLINLSSVEDVRSRLERP